MDNKYILPLGFFSIGLGFLVFQLTKKPNVTYSNNAINQNVTLYGEPFNAKILAQKLKEAMLPSGTFEGTIESEIIKLLTGITQEQFYKIIVAFGSQKYNSYIGSQTLAVYSYPLTFWLKNELGASSDEYKTLQTLFPKYLK